MTARRRLRPAMLPVALLVAASAVPAIGSMHLSTVFSIGSAAGDDFGAAVSGVGTNVVIGAPGVDDTATDEGKAYLFDGLTGALLQTFVNPNPAANSRFGAAVGAVGSNVLVGAPADGAPGSAYLFDASNGMLLQTFVSPAPATDDHFGEAIAGFGAKAIVGAPDGSPAGAFVFDAGSGMFLQALLPVLPPPHRLGAALATTAFGVIVGAPGVAAEAGAAFLFDGTTGLQLQRWNGPSGARFGAAVAALGANVVVGAPEELVSGVDAGAAYVFDGTNGAPIVHKPNPDPDVGDGFGTGVVGNGTDFVVSTGTNELWFFDGTTGAQLVWYYGTGGFGPALGPVAPSGDFVLGTPANNDAFLWDRCGNSALYPREQCDDGNTIAGDGCAPNCGFEVCPATPLTDCDNNGSWPPGTHSLVIHDDANPNRDALKWRQKTYSPIYYDPLLDTAYYFCIYDFSAGTPTLVYDVSLLPAGTCGSRACWRGRGTPYIYPYSYQDRAGTRRGVMSLKLKHRVMQLKARGANLAPPGLPLVKDTKVVAQLGNSRGLCWSADYSSATANTGTDFSARSD